MYQNVNKKDEINLGKTGWGEIHLHIFSWLNTSLQKGCNVVFSTKLALLSQTVRDYSNSSDRLGCQLMNKLLNHDWHCDCALCCTQSVPVSMFTAVGTLFSYPVVNRIGSCWKRGSSPTHTTEGEGAHGLCPQSCKDVVSVHHSLCHSYVSSTKRKSFMPSLSDSWARRRTYGMFELYPANRDAFFTLRENAKSWWQSSVGRFQWFKSACSCYRK